MNSLPYKLYLGHLKEERKRQKKLILIIGLFSVIVFTGVVLSLFFWQSKKVGKFEKEIAHLQRVQADFNSTSDSINDLLASFKVAGIKVSYLDTNKESIEQALAFFTALDDLEKNISKMQTISENIKVTQEELTKSYVNSEYEALKNNLTSYYQESLITLDKLIDNHQKAKDLLITSGVNFSLPVLTQEELWKKGENQQILDYYLKTKDQATLILNSLYELDNNSQFTDYIDAQIAYLTLVIRLSTNIINTLNLPDEDNFDVPTQKERAYQTLTGAKRENEILAAKILSERLKIIDLERNLENFAPVKLKENSLENEFELTMFEITTKNNGNLDSFVEDLTNYLK